ncbi:MAG TPA: hypothetical protein DCS67_11405 [Clostridiales bacterium UBA8960]|jgi:hypothetical protein|nr:hypothetical protein [Clostridiales bacterium UBA8960]
MIKKCSILAILFLVIVLTGKGVSHANPHMGGERTSAKVYLSNQEIAFEKTPFLLGGEVMVSARLFFEKIGAQVLWIESTGEIIAYRDNLFLKFKPHTKNAFVNGQVKRMPVHAVIYDGDLFISASFAAKTLEMNHTSDLSSRSVSIDHRENILEYQQFGYRHFKRASIANWGISFYIPEYWKKSETENNKFETDDMFEPYTLTANYHPLSQPFTRSLLRENLIAELEQQHGASFQLISSSTVRLGEYLSDVVTYDIESADGMKHYILYVFFEQANGYTLLGEYRSVDAYLESKEIFDLIAGTFSITKLSINEQLEHYTELGSFHSLGIDFRKTIFSNMPVNNQFAFTGTISNSDMVKGFHVVVSKEGEQVSYYAPVIDGAFNTRIFTPFGLGKHNITVVLDRIEDEENASLVTPPIEAESINQDEIDLPFDVLLDKLVLETLRLDVNLSTIDNIMKFSVLNISADQIRYVLPTEYINYDYDALYNISNTLTFRLTNQAAKSKALYDWILGNYIYTETLRDGKIMSVRELIDQTRANSIELCMLYTGFLRSIDIPARIVKGIALDSTEYWVESFINGRWYVSDIVRDVAEKNEISEYFNKNQNLHYEDYAIIEYLSY